MTATKTKRPVWTPGTVTVATGGGRREIEAEVWGVWAVHPTIQAFAYGWEATHIPTGYGCYLSAKSKAAAKKFCAEVDPLWDWSAVNGQTGTQAMPTEIKQQVLDAAKRARP